MVKKRGKKTKATKQKNFIQKAVPESHKGRFTAWSKRHGFKGTTAASIKAGMHSSNSHVRHMALFAHNMRRLNHK